MTIASDIRAALASAGAPQSAAEVHQAIGDDIPAARVACALSAMKKRGEVQCDEDARPRTYTLDPSFKPSRARPGEAAEPRPPKVTKAGAPRRKPGRKPGRKPKAKPPARAARAPRQAQAKAAPPTASRALATPRAALVRTVSERSLRLLTAAVLASDLELTGSLRDALGEAQRAIAIESN